MPDYSKSIIYKLYDNTNGNVYYGSTCNLLRVRINGHKSTATNNSKSKCTSKSIILNGDYAYSVVESFPCGTIQELRTRERYWIENFTCINKKIPTRTKQEYREEHVEYYKKYMKDYYNRKKTLPFPEYSKDYYKNI
jgi:hypothetical protein